MAITYKSMRGTLPLAKNLTACIKSPRLLVQPSSVVVMTKEAQQNLGAMHFAEAKPSYSATEPWQEVTLHLHNLHKTASHFTSTTFTEQVCIASVHN